MLECAAPNELGLNDDAGILEDTYQGGSGVGSHTGLARSNDCRGVCFRLLYHIEDLGPIPPARTG
jgi:hypothetical protein